MCKKEKNHRELEDTLKWKEKKIQHAKTYGKQLKQWKMNSCKYLHLKKQYLKSTT